MKQQIVVITGENVIEEGVIIEQEGENTQSNAMQRSRKQQIETINTEDDTNGTEKIEPMVKRGRQETAPPATAGSAGRTTRASAKDRTSESTDKTAETNAEDKHKDEDEEEEVDDEEDEEMDTNDDKEALVSQKRTRGRPPKNIVTSTPTPSATPEDDSSPIRKSSRIAKK
jgi:hypothetical protein